MTGTSRKPHPAGNGWLSAHDAASYLGIHQNTLRRIPATDLPYFLLNPRGDRRYSPVDLDAYIKQRMVRS